VDSAFAAVYEEGSAHEEGSAYVLAEGSVLAFVEGSALAFVEGSALAFVEDFSCLKAAGSSSFV
jgi:hypothetical protein